MSRDMTDQQAELDGWERTLELRWLLSPTPGDWPTLQQKWTKFIHGYGEDYQEHLWLAVAAVRE